MERITHKYGIKLLFIAGFIFTQFLLLCSITMAQDNTVSGVITDAASQEPLPGVNIKIQGTAQGTVSNSQGKYSLNVASLSDTLIFSFIGYQRQEIPIYGRTTIDIEMSSQTLTGEELVVVGYGEQRSEDVTGSVSSVSMSNVESQPVSGVDQQLTGQIAGVQVNNTGGVPGGGPQIRIRGLGAIGAGSQPLYVVDGFPLPSSTNQVSNPLNDIPPGNIQSISVLKDASATAIYGSRGANGVVLITTKSGQDGDTHININAYTGLQQIPEIEYPDVLNAQQFAKFQKERIEEEIRYTENRNPTADDIPGAYEQPEQYGEGTDWYDEITRIAPTRNFSASLSGGNDKLRSFISAGYLGQQGVVVGSDYKRFSLRANVDAKLSDKLNVGFNMSPTYSIRQQVSVGSTGRGGALGNAIVSSPIPSVYNEDGSYNTMIASPQTFNYPNPLQQLKEINDETKTGRFLASAFGEYEIVNGLQLKNSINIDWNYNRGERYNPSTVGGIFSPPPVIPSSSLSESSYLNWLNETTLRYQTNIGPHSIQGLAGFTIQKNNAVFANLIGNEYPRNDEIKNLSAAAEILGGSGEEDWALISYLSRLNYSFRDTYLLTATVRRDGSSRFGNNNRWGLFPSAALGWRISNEPFMADVSWIQDLKIRLSYGVSGNFEIGNYSYAGQVTSNDYILDAGLAPGKNLTSLRNPNLGWERTEETNIGLDFGILNDRFQFTADIYKRNTNDLLLNVEIPASSGFNSVTENRGNIENKGLELGVTSNNFTGESFQWTTNLNISFNRNEVIGLGRSDAPIVAGRAGAVGPTNITMIGKPVGLFYGYVHEGLYDNQEEINNSVSYPGAIPGNVKYKDVNGDGNITLVDDFAVIGDPYPDFTWGMTNNFSYHNLNLKILLTGSYGGQILDASPEYKLNIDGVFNVSTDVLDRWKSPENPGDGIVPRTTGSQSRVLFRSTNSTWVHDNSYLWIKNVTLGYDLPKSLVGKFMRNANIYLSIQNALLFSEYDGNPEVSNYAQGPTSQYLQQYGGILTPGIDYSNYPVPRVFTVGAKLSF